jgi:BirA family transcriptional regulator, biotin operon repressor / biotin---[acetyl-CoA-carboxylase] ligase
VSLPAATPSFAGGWPEPFRVTWCEETGSTNADLVELAREGGVHGAVLVADHQTAGRGRLGRTWSAPPGSALLCSVLLRPPPSAPIHGGVWAMALAAQAAAASVAGVTAELKWPNDLMIGERKLAGILAEAVAEPGEGGATGAVIVGIGLNVSWSHPPPDVAARAVTLEALAGRRVDRGLLLRALLVDLGPLLKLWATDPDALAARYRAALATIGRAVRVTLADREIEGEALDLTAEGALVVATDSGPVVVSAGDVVHLRPS